MRAFQSNVNDPRAFHCHDLDRDLTALELKTQLDIYIKVIKSYRLLWVHRLANTEAEVEENSLISHNPKSFVRSSSHRHSSRRG